MFSSALVCSLAALHKTYLTYFTKSGGLVSRGLWKSRLDFDDNLDCFMLRLGLQLGF